MPAYIALPFFFARRFVLGVCLLTVLSAIIPVAQAASPMPDELLLQQQLIAGRFDDLEQELGTLQGDYLAGRHNDWIVDYAFRTFDSTNPLLEKPLAQWVKQAPGSAIAHVAHGIYLEARGWAMRGGNWASQTGDDQFDGMRQYFSEADGEFKKAIALDPTMSVAYAHLIRMSKAFSTSNAQALLHEALAHCPRSFAVRYEYVFGLQPRWGGSMAAIRQFVDDGAAGLQDTAALAVLRGFEDYSVAEDLVQDKHYKAAEGYYTDALKGVKFAPYYIARGDARRWADQPDAALMDYNEALALQPHYPSALKGRADAYMDLGRLKEARSDIDTALQLDPMNPYLLQTSAWLYLNGNQLSAALADYKKSTTFDPQNADTYASIGYIEQKQKDYLAATAAYKRATSLAPDNAEYWYDFAEPLYARKQCEIRYPLVRFKRLCNAIADAACTTSRLQWTDHILAFIRSNPACAKTTDDTPPDAGLVR